MTHVYNVNASEYKIAILILHTTENNCGKQIQYEGRTEHAQ